MSDRDYTDQAAVLSSDLLTMLESHPESFPCLFFKPDLATAEVVAPVIEDVVGSIEGSERKLDYYDPVPARALLVPDQDLGILAFESGVGEDIRSGKEPVVLILSVSPVPKQSIITWTEKTSSGKKQVSFYVLESKPLGRSPVAGMKHYCIPLLSKGEQDGQ